MNPKPPSTSKQPKPTNTNPPKPPIKHGGKIEKRQAESMRGERR